jgi:hypothetical protein
MLQKPLPLLFIFPPLDSRLSPADPRLPVRTLFALPDRVVAGFSPKAPAACLGLDLPRRKQIHRPHARVYNQAVQNRLSSLSRTPGLRAGLQCSLSALPLEDETGEGTAAGKLALYNHGDAYGEEKEGSGPVTCPPSVLRDLRDLAAARLADWPGGVVLNQGLLGDKFIASRRGIDRFPWVHLEFSSCLWMKPDGTLLAKKVHEFADRLENILTLWCRLQAW